MKIFEGKVSMEYHGEGKRGNEIIKGFVLFEKRKGLL